VVLVEIQPVPSGKMKCAHLDMGGIKRDPTPPFLHPHHQESEKITDGSCITTYYIYPISPKPIQFPSLSHSLRLIYENQH